MECSWLLFSTLTLAAILRNAELAAVLHFSVIVSSGEDFNSLGSVPAVDLALKMLQIQSVLPEGYSFAYSMQDSEVSTESLFQHNVVHSNPILSATRLCL